MTKVVTVSYSKLKRLASSHPAYRMIEEENRVELVFYPPTEESASSTSDFERDYGETVIRIIGVRVGDVVEIREAYVENGENRRRLSPEELELWVNEVEWLA